jgi:hypothetical protein
MDGVIDGIGVVFLFVCLYGLAAWVKPFWLIKRRWQGAGLVAASVTVLIAVSERAPTRPADIAPDMWAQRVAVCREANMDRACPNSSAMVLKAIAQVRVATLAAVPAPSAASAVAPPVVAAASAPPDPKAGKASFLRTQEAMSGMVRPCDTAMIKATATRSVYASYNAAKRAEEACKASMMALFDLRFEEPVPSAARAELDPTLNCFANAYGAREQVMGQAAKLMDGDQSPSKVSDFRASMTDAMARTRECAAQYAAVAVKYGYRDEVAKMARSS